MRVQVHSPVGETLLDYTTSGGPGDPPFGSVRQLAPGLDDSPAVRDALLEALLQLPDARRTQVDAALILAGAVRTREGRVVPGPAEGLVTPGSSIPPCPGDGA